MKIHDISMTIKPHMTVYKNKDIKRPTFETISDFTTGSSYETKLSLDLHTGTHIDAPLHMIENGQTIDQYDLSKFITKATVLDLTHVDVITKQELEKFDIKSGDFILLKTRNSYTEEFDFEFVYLEQSGAAYLKECGVIGVGIDALGIERAQPEHNTHQILLSCGIIIIEGLRLSEVKEGTYTLIAPPIKIDQVEASFTRALLLEDE